MTLSPEPALLEQQEQRVWIQISCTENAIMKVEVELPIPCLHTQSRNWLKITLGAVQILIIKMEYYFILFS